MAEADLSLLQRFSEGGDEQAFAQIVHRYADFVYATGLRLLGDRAFAEDVAQETFFRLLRNPTSVTRSLGGWLHRTATQLAIDRIRSDASRRRREESYAQTHHREVATWQELSPYVDEAMEELPDDARELLVEHFLAGRSQRELAAQRNVSNATISRQVQAGLALLRQKLRSRGITAAASALVVPLLLDPAPMRLLHELGKMALASGAVSPAAPGSPAGGCGAAAVESAAVAGETAIKFAYLALLTVCFIGTAILIYWQASSPAAAPARPTRIDRDRADAPAGRHAAAYLLIDTADSLDPARIVAVENPSAAAGDTLAVVFADGHVERLALDDVRSRVHRQTGLTLDQVAATQPKNPPGS